MSAQELIDTGWTLKRKILKPNMVLPGLTCGKKKSKVCGPLLTTENGMPLNDR